MRSTLLARLRRLLAPALLLIAGHAAFHHAAHAAPVCPPEPEALSPARLTALASDRGLMWTLKRDGRTSFLYASLHLGKPAWAAPGPLMSRVLSSVDAVALEIDPLDTTAWRMPAMPALPLDDALRKRLDTQAESVCVPAQALEAMHPLLRVSTYTLLRARALGLDVRYGQEMLISRWARERSLPVLSLETLEGQLTALLPQDPEAARHELRAGLRQLERPKPLERMLTQLVGHWERGDLQQLSRYENWCDCVADQRDRAAMVRLNDERNPNLAERVSELHQAGQSLLVAVGALHMTGPQALPELLRQKGFEVTLVHPPSSR